MYMAWDFRVLGLRVFEFTSSLVKALGVSLPYRLVCMADSGLEAFSDM